MLAQHRAMRHVPVSPTIVPMNLGEIGPISVVSAIGVGAMV